MWESRDHGAGVESSFSQGSCPEFVLSCRAVLLPSGTSDHRVSAVSVAGEGLGASTCSGTCLALPLPQPPQRSRQLFQAPAVLAAHWGPTSEAQAGTGSAADLAAARGDVVFSSWHGALAPLQRARSCCPSCGVLLHAQILRGHTDTCRWAHTRAPGCEKIVHPQRRGIGKRVRAQH